MPEEPAEIVVVYVTAPEKDAPAVARGLIDRRVAACVNIIPSVRSIYRWEDAIQDDAESLLVIKTSRDRFGALEEAVTQLHPYSVPEVIALPVVEAHEPYRRWVKESVG